MSGMIPQSFIDNLLDRLDIVDTVDSRVKLRKTDAIGSLLAALRWAP